MNKILGKVLERILFLKIHITEDIAQAEHSIFQYKMLPKSEVQHRFYLTVLGAINGPLPKYTGKVLVAHFDEEGNLFKLSLKEKWW